MFRVRLQLKLNTDESPGVATEYGIRSIPTVMVFKVRAPACIAVFSAGHCAAARRLRSFMQSCWWLGELWP